MCACVLAWCVWVWVCGCVWGGERQHRKGDGVAEIKGCTVRPVSRSAFRKKGKKGDNVKGFFMRGSN